MELLSLFPLSLIHMIMQKSSAPAKQKYLLFIEFWLLKLIFDKIYAKILL